LSRTHLRSRVLLLTAAFALALFAITFGLSWRARWAQERWSRIIGVETESVARLEEFIRAHNAFMRNVGTGSSLTRYRAVTQLLELPALAEIDTTLLRGRIRAFETILGESSPREQDVEATSRGVVGEAQRMIDLRKAEIARQLPSLERESAGMMTVGLAVAWIVVMVSFAVAQLTLKNVVRPLEDLARGADEVAEGDPAARAPVGGDLEIYKLGIAFNRMADELKARARTDDLTGLPNFRAFRERIDAEIDRVRRYQETFGVLVLDLDRFKQYNDRFGHLAGNDALQSVARVIRETVRAVDFPARYGGEEFAIIVPRINHAALAAIAERIRAGVEALPAPASGATITVSIGAAACPEDGCEAESLFHAADERLYQAKGEGRNRVVGAITPRAGQSTDRSCA
jgi:diguanylate cyclase (GGDEF)-like protein